MPWDGSAIVVVAQNPSAIPAAPRRMAAKKSGLILATIPHSPCLFGADPKDGFTSFQTFSLDHGEGLLIKVSLLDRFLACMKPASIT